MKNKKIETLQLEIKRLELIRAKIGGITSRRKASPTSILYYFNTNDVKYTPTKIADLMYDCWSKSKAGHRADAVKEYNKKRYAKLSSKILSLKKKCTRLIKEAEADCIKSIGIYGTNSMVSESMHIASSFFVHNDANPPPPIPVEGDSYVMEEPDYDEPLNDDEF